MPKRETIYSYNLINNSEIKSMLESCGITRDDLHNPKIKTILEKTLQRIQTAICNNCALPVWKVKNEIGELPENIQYTTITREQELEIIKGIIKVVFSAVFKITKEKAKNPS